jgi:hypothetical protein
MSFENRDCTVLYSHEPVVWVGDGEHVARQRNSIAKARAIEWVIQARHFMPGAVGAALE